MFQRTPHSRVLSVTCVLILETLKVFAQDPPARSPLEFKEEPDDDVHLVIQGTSGELMIAEIPDPACSEGSRLQTEIAHARARFVDLFGQPSRTSWIEADDPITVTGVLFFDARHGQIGVAPNAVELHPVFDIGP